MTKFWERHGRRTIVPVAVFLLTLFLVTSWPHDHFTTPVVSETQARALLFSALAVATLRIAWVEAPAVWNWVSGDWRRLRFVLVATAAPLALLFFLNAQGEWRMLGIKTQESMTIFFALVGVGIVSELLYRAWRR